MKFLRVGEAGHEIPCILDEAGQARDISSLITDITPQNIETLCDKVAASPLESLPVIDTQGQRIGAPLSQPPNIYCIGLNFSDHAEEAGMAIPSEPVLFNKSSVTYCGPNDPIPYSPKMSKMDWEVELAIVIRKSALNVSVEAAPDHILGYTVVHDVSERAWQIEREGQWAKGKGFPNFCPTGPLLATPDEVGNARALNMWLDVNGERMQTGNTRTMIFDCATIVSYLSEFTRLQPGDLICTGTPPGVGFGMNPPRYMNIGDTVSLGIEGLGEQSQRVIPLAEFEA